MSAPSKEALRKALGQYGSVLKARVDSGQAIGARDLVDLDERLWGPLSERLQRTRREDKGKEKDANNVDCKLSLQELHDIMRWKLARGKFRPTLPSLIAKNTEADVTETTRVAFQWQSAQEPDSLGRLKTLGKLKGVGPATASLILSLLDPQEEAFMSDESWECLEALKDRKLKYTDKDWVLWREEMRKRKEEEGWESMRALEKACWAYVQGKEDLERSRPAHSRSGIASPVTSASKLDKRKENDSAGQQETGKRQKRAPAQSNSKSPPTTKRSTRSTPRS